MQTIGDLIDFETIGTDILAVNHANLAVAPAKCAANPMLARAVHPLTAAAKTAVVPALGPARARMMIAIDVTIRHCTGAAIVTEIMTEIVTVTVTVPIGPGAVIEKGLTDIFLVVVVVVAASAPIAVIVRGAHTNGGTTIAGMEIDRVEQDCKIRIATFQAETQRTAKATRTRIVRGIVRGIVKGTGVEKGVEIATERVVIIEGVGAAVVADDSRH